MTEARPTHRGWSPQIHSEGGDGQDYRDWPPHRSIVSEQTERAVGKVFNIFNSNVFIEIGEAIGNVGRTARKKLKRRSNPELVDRAFRRQLKACKFELPDEPGMYVEPDEEDVIDVEFRVLNDEEVET